MELLLAAVLLSSVSVAQTRGPAEEAQRAQELAAAGKLEEAIRVYQNLLRASPRNAVLLLNLSITEYKARQYGNSVTHASAALEVQPDLLPARLFLGAAQLELGEFAKAVGSLEAVVAATPQDRNARLMLGEALLATGKPAEAAVQFEAVAEQLPANPRIWYGLARVYELLGRSEAAQQAADKLLALPESAESHMRAAMAHEKAQRWIEASAEWKKALAVSSDRRGARVSLAWSLFRARDYDGAMAALQPLEGSSAEVEFLIGACLLNRQQPREAIAHLRSALAHDAGLVPARAALGQALLQTGKPEEAIGWLKAALDGDTDGTVHFQLFRAYQLTHRESEAREALAAYQRLRSSR